jgi:archaellum component FlaG (FlaF/FlaG flagellin family)
MQFAENLNKTLKVQTLYENDTENDTEDDELFSLPERYKYEIVEQENNVIYLDSEETEEIELTLKNIGKSEWDLNENSENRFVLGTYLPRQRESVFYNSELEKWKDSTTIYVEDEDEKTTIEPGDTVTFNFEIKAPKVTGIYRENFAPMVTGIKGLNNTQIVFDIVVGEDFSESYDYEIVEKSEREAISLNGTKEIVLKIKNTGKVAWYSGNPFPVKLVTDNNTSAQLGKQ